jgi:spectinomycin phosphotransferase
MLEKPDIRDDEIVACLRDEFGLHATRITFLPLGADPQTAVYRAVGANDTPYFVKLRWGTFDETSVTLPQFLGEQGIGQIIVPLATPTGRPWANLGPLAMILYPFISGEDAYAVCLSDGQWIDLGRALKQIHTVTLPAQLSGQLQRERYSPRWRNRVETHLASAAHGSFADPVAAETAALLNVQRGVILDLVGRAAQLARELVDRPPASVLCHADLHAGNVLVPDPARFYIVDWDNPLLAPKERDLMSIGAGLMGGWRSPAEEESLFYQGYGPTTIDPTALAYYRYERIIDDVAVFCDQLLENTAGGEDRAQSFAYLASNFQPNGTIEIARASDHDSLFDGTRRRWHNV